MVALAFLAVLLMGVAGGVLLDRIVLRPSLRLDSSQNLDTFTIDGATAPTRFAVAYYTASGATARQLLERATPKSGDTLVLLDGGVERGRKNG